MSLQVADAPRAVPAAAAQADESFEPIGWLADAASAAGDGAAWITDRRDALIDSASEAIIGAADAAEHGLDGLRERIDAWGDRYGAPGWAASRPASATLGVAGGAGRAVFDAAEATAGALRTTARLVSALDWTGHPERNLETLSRAAHSARTLVKLGTAAGWVLDREGNTRAAQELWAGASAGYRRLIDDGDWPKLAGHVIGDGLMLAAPAAVARRVAQAPRMPVPAALGEASAARQAAAAPAIEAAALARPAGALVGASGAHYELAPLTSHFAKVEAALPADIRTVRYLAPTERGAYELFARDGRLCDVHGTPLDTTAPVPFVMDREGRLFASTAPGAENMLHSVFLGGEPVAMAGEFEARGGRLVSLSNRSGHYLPPPRMLDNLLRELSHRGVAPPPDDAITLLDWRRMFR